MYVSPYVPSRDNIISDNIFFKDGILVKESGNTFSNNKINGKPLIYLEGESNKIIDGRAGQIILINCNNIEIKYKILSSTTIGLDLINSHNCLISRNKISGNTISGISIEGNDNTISNNWITRNREGIYIVGDNNMISRNNIIINLRGLFWIGIDNIVQENNFIFNIRNAKFYVESKEDYTTSWSRNYWGRPRVIKIVHGARPYELSSFLEIPIPCIGFDWRPAKLPYIILVT